LLPLGNASLEDAGRFLLTVIGPTGMDESLYTSEGIITTVELRGKLYADTPEGVLSVTCKSARLTALDFAGAPVTEIEGAAVPGGMIFTLDGKIPAVHFLLERIAISAGARNPGNAPPKEGAGV
jgi:hypothetical protein